MIRSGRCPGKDGKANALREEPLSKPGHRLKDNIKTESKETNWNCWIGFWFRIAREKNQCRDGALLKLPIP
jgi:hypothetical protein